MRVVLPCIKQGNLKSKKVQIDTSITEKEGILKRPPKLNKIIEFSVYDTKPFYHISMVSA